MAKILYRICFSVFSGRSADHLFKYFYEMLVTVKAAVISYCFHTFMGMLYSVAGGVYTQPVYIFLWRQIKGLCCHHDHAGIGIAANDSVQEYRMAQMKSMGANAYRSAHHMPTDELLDICDRMEMLVFDETRRMSSAPQDLECLEKMVKHARNYPCVFLYGIGNEEIFSQHRAETARTILTMKNVIRKLDPSRPVTSAVVCWNGKERFENAAAYVEVTKHLDVMGFNYCMSSSPTGTLGTGSGRG